VGEASRSSRWLLYGATGYSGQLIARSAAEQGAPPVLCGRDHRKLEALAAELGAEFRVAALEDAASMDRALDGMNLVLHAAGPFSRTAAPMLEACFRTRTHYLDLTGEIAVVERLAAEHARAKSCGIMIMPGVGLDVVAGDCLALHVSSRVPRARRLALGVQGLRLVSRGTARTIVEAAGGGFARREGRICPITLGSLERSFDFGEGAVPCLNVSWADVATAWYTTGIGDVDVYCEAIPLLRVLSASNRFAGRLLSSPPWQAWMMAHVDLLPPGPGPDERAAAFAVFVAEVEGTSGNRASSRLRTPEAYTFTAMVAPVIAARVLAGDVEAGFQTPARVYGADFPLKFEGVTREDLS
jgi:short subunit dehydrogenase-like uncharacterized protein